MREPRFGVGLWQGLTSQRLGMLVRLAEQEGFDQVWYSNHKLYRDMLVGLAVAALHSERVQLGTFVAEPYSQHPALIAAAVATLDELCAGRAILGLGTGGANFKELGIERVRPALAMRESIQVIRRLLAGERVEFEGELFTARDVWLHLPSRAELPIVIASRGDRVLQVAGELADGAMIATYATPQGLRHGREMVRLGLARAGRGQHQIDLMARVDVAINADRRTALDAVRPMIAAMIMASYPDVAFVKHAGLELTPELEEIARQKDEGLAFGSGHLVPDEFVRQFAWVGPPSEVAEQVAAVADAGFGGIVVLPQPLTDDPGPTLQIFAREVIPRVRALLG